MPQFPKINYICHSFSMTDDYWDSRAPLAINQTAGQGEEDRGEQKEENEEGKQIRR